MEAVQREARVLDQLRALSQVAVAFSAGVDSTYLLALAHEALGERVVAVTADSPSLTRATLAEARAFCAAHGIRHEVVATREFSDPVYLANDGQRCGHCKSHLMEALRALDSCQGAVALLGAIADDLTDHRPGQAAAAARGARFPLAEAGFTKAEVRERSRVRGLPTADRPAEPCLSSRVPYGEPVSAASVAMIEQAEAALRHAGFATCRARHHAVGGGRAWLCRIEVPDADIPRLLELRRSVEPALRRIGYGMVTIDLAGFRSGGLNDLLVVP
jgi:uncharacterized protein